MLAVLAVVSVVFVFASDGAPATSFGTVVAWGCGAVFIDRGQCNVPGGLAGVTAIAAADAHSLAVQSDGTVLAWGCRSPVENVGQCNVPGGLSGVTAVAAGEFSSLAL